MDIRRLIYIVMRWLRKWSNPDYFITPLMMRTRCLGVDGCKYIKYLNSENYGDDVIMNYPVPGNMSNVATRDMSSPEGRIYEIPNAKLITNYPDKSLLLDEHGAFIEDFSNTMKSPSSFNWRDTRRKSTETIATAAIFRGVSNNYYHTLIDNAPRLLSLHTDHVRSMDHLELLCVKKMTAVEEYLFEKLLPENVSIRILEEGEAYKIEKCLLPTYVTSQYSGYVPTNVLEFFRNKLLPDRERRNDRRIYISRKKAAFRRVLNEDELVEELSGYGFNCYFLEDLSFEQQIEIFYDAGMVVGPHGAGFTNLVFSKKPYVLELFPYRYVKPSYYYLSKSVEGIYDFTVAEGSEINVDFYVDVNKVTEKILRHMS